MRIIYLHGFASSSFSRKAQFFQANLDARGIPASVPNLDGGNFENLTISGQYEILTRLADGQPVTLIGSSMGGYLASLYASRHPEVEKLVLLAPAFGFQTRWPAIMGEPAFAEWQRTGSMEVFHYADRAPRHIGFQLVTDAARWDNTPDFHQPALILHGRQDPVVPAVYSEQYAATHPNVALHLFDDGHELNNVLPEMWNLTAEFLQIGGQ